MNGPYRTHGIRVAKKDAMKLNLRLSRKFEINANDEKWSSRRANDSASKRANDSIDEQAIQVEDDRKKDGLTSNQ